MADLYCELDYLHKQTSYLIQAIDLLNSETQNFQLSRNATELRPSLPHPLFSRTGGPCALLRFRGSLASVSSRLFPTAAAGAGFIIPGAPSPSCEFGVGFEVLFLGTANPGLLPFEVGVVGKALQAASYCIISSLMYVPRHKDLVMHSPHRLTLVSDEQVDNATGKNFLLERVVELVPDQGGIQTNNLRGSMRSALQWCWNSRNMRPWSFPKHECLWL